MRNASHGKQIPNKHYEMLKLNNITFEVTSHIKQQDTLKRNILNQNDFRYSFLNTIT